MKKILFVTNRVPFPPNRGDKIRGYQFLKYLAANNEITLFSLGDNEDAKYLGSLKKICHKTVFVKQKHIVARINFLHGLLSFKKPSIVLHFFSKKADREIHALIKKDKFDLIFCKSSVMAQYFFKKNYKIKLVVDLCDIDSDRYRQYFKKVNPLVRFFLKKEVAKLSAFENQIFALSQKVILSSEAEISQVKKAHLKRILIVKNGIDFDYFKPQRQAQTKEAKILFTGTMKYFPNIDAVKWFAGKIFPRIVKSIPGAKFFIVGQSPSKEVLHLGSKLITITGAVDDIRPYYNQAAVFVAPLRIARGSQTKVMEAMAMGVPCVITKKVALGLGIKRRCKFIKIDDSEIKIAQKIIDLIGKKNEASSELRKIGRKNFDWRKNLEALNVIWRQSDVSSTTRQHGGARKNKRQEITGEAIVGKKE